MVCQRLPAHDADGQDFLIGYVDHLLLQPRLLPSSERRCLISIAPFLRLNSGWPVCVSIALRLYYILAIKACLAVEHLCNKLKIQQVTC
jgi:hypothetical protein